MRSVGVSKNSSSDIFKKDLRMIDDKLMQAQDLARQRIKQLILPVVIFVIGAFSLIFFGIWQNSKIHDQQGIEASEFLLKSILDDKKTSLETLANDFA